MKFDIYNYKGKYAIHCKTAKEAEHLLNFLKETRMVDPLIDIKDYYTSHLSYFYSSFGHNKAAYYFNEHRFGDLYLAQATGYRIIEWSEIMNNTFKFIKADLKTGDVIKHRCGKVGILNLEIGVIIYPKGWEDFDCMDTDLRNCNSPSYDIVAVRRPIKKSDCQFDAFERELGNPIYDL